MKNCYAGLDNTRNYLTLASPESQDDDAILNLLHVASRAIDRYARRKFYPRRETRFYDYTGDPDRKTGQLTQRLDDDLLSLTTFKTQNGACTVASGVMWVATGANWNRTPADHIYLKEDSGSTLSYSGTPQRANEVTGIWGYHEDYANAWVDTGTSLARDTGANASLLNLAGAGSFGTAASDVEYEYPRISRGDLIKIQDEYFHVLNSGSTNTLVLTQSAANGTAAASHASGASIARWKPERDIEFAARRLAAWYYAQRNSPFTAKTAIPALGEITYPPSWPDEVREILEKYRRPSMWNI